MRDAFADGKLLCGRGEGEVPTGCCCSCGARVVPGALFRDSGSRSTATTSRVSHEHVCSGLMPLDSLSEGARASAPGLPLRGSSVFLGRGLPLRGLLHPLRSNRPSGRRFSHVFLLSTCIRGFRPLELPLKESCKNQLWAAKNFRSP